MHSRIEDEVTLRVLAYHAEGQSARWISKKLGLTQTVISRRINAVRDADCAHDPDARTYWAATPKGKPA